MIMDKFYYSDLNGSAHYDIPLTATTWEDAIMEVKTTLAYAKLSYSKTFKKKLNIVYDYVEIHKNVLRKDMTFEDLRNPEVYHKVY